MDEELLRKYESYCQQIVAIEKKLQNSHLPQGKREKLIFQLRDLEERIIPRFLLKIKS